MGMFDFFRKKESVEEDVKIESFEDAEKIFKDKGDLLREREKGVLLEIGGKLEEFYISVEEKLVVLEGIDIESKKEYDKAKILVRQGLDKYIDSVRVLLKDLKKLKKDDLGDFSREVGRVFVGFEKTSFKVYERATYLVGDEMMAVRNEIRRFYNGLLKMFEKDKLLIENLGKIEDVELKFDEVGKIGDKIKDFRKEILVNEDEIEKNKIDIERLNGEILEIKKSSGYVAGLKVKKEVADLERDIEANIVKLKGFIDFKKLIGIVHTNKRELEIVKRFRDFFVSEFSRGGGVFLDLLKDSNMKNDKIEEQISLIEKLKGELVEKREGVGLDSSVVKFEEAKKIEEKIEDMKIGNVKVKQRLKEFLFRMDESKGEIIGLIDGLGKCL